MDIKNTVWVLPCACPDIPGVATPYHLDMTKSTPRQYFSKYQESDAHQKLNNIISDKELLTERY
jgi:hypothetical protein